MLCSPRGDALAMAASSGGEITHDLGWWFMSTRRTRGNWPLPMRLGISSRR